MRKRWEFREEIEIGYIVERETNDGEERVEEKQKVREVQQ